MIAHGIRPSGYRLPAGAHPGRVRLQVSDLQQSLDFYQRVLGMRATIVAPNRATLGGGGDEPVLVELVERRGARQVPRRGTLGLYHFAILLPDRQALGRFLRHALPTGTVSGMADHAVSEAIYLNDPDGLGIEVYRDRPVEAWRVDANRQLHMTTEHLDVDDVVDAGGSEPWDGLPSGTVMGHVHLHVGDLTNAEAFYHRALGFDKVVWTFPGALFLSAGGYHHHLGTNTWSSGMPAAMDQARLLSWDLHLPTMEDAAAAAASVVGAGYAAEKDGDHWSTADPWGTALHLLA